MARFSGGTYSAAVDESKRLIALAMLGITKYEFDKTTNKLTLYMQDGTVVEAALTAGLPNGKDGKSLEFHWDGTRLGIRKEGETDYSYVDLKGRDGEPGGQGPQGIQGEQGPAGADGKSLEFHWDGTRLGVRKEGEIEYSYVDLKGQDGSSGTGAAGFTVDNPFKGKIANFLGDSQTDPAQHYTEKGYHQWISEILELGSYNNYGKSGTTLARKNSNDITAFSVRYADMDDNADLIIVMGGVNDRWFNNQLGQFGDSTVDTVYGALEVLCDGLMTKYPGKTIIFVTPTEENSLHNQTAPTVKQIANAMKTVCDKYGMKLYDANTQLGIYPKNAANAAKYTTDKLHLNTKGHEVLGKGLANYILFGSPASYTIINVNGSGGGTGGSDSNVSVSSVSISGANSLNVNNSIELTATISPSNATNKNVTWSIDSDTYATITPNGNKCTVTAKDTEGTATVTVTTSDGNKTASKTISIINNADVNHDLSGKVVTATSYAYDSSFLGLYISTAGLSQGDTLTLTGGITPGENFGSLNSATSTFSAISKVVSENGDSKVITSERFLVSGTPDSFTFTGILKNNINSYPYARVPLAIKPANTSAPMSYTINSLTVSVNGVQKDIVAYGPLLTNANMTIENGSGGGTGGSDSNVSVSSVSISGANSLNVNNSIELTATISPSNATNKNVTWSIDSDTYATIIPNGNKCTVTAKDTEGTATVTVTTSDGNKTASKTISIINNADVNHDLSGKVVTATSYIFNSSYLALYISTTGLSNGDTVTLTGGITPGENFGSLNGATFTFGAISNVVSENGTANSTDYTSNQLSLSGTPDSFTFTATLNNKINSYPYVRVPLGVKPANTSAPMSYTINSLTVSVNGVQKDIVAYGSITSNAIMTIE